MNSSSFSRIATRNIFNSLFIVTTFIFSACHENKSDKQCAVQKSFSRHDMDSIAKIAKAEKDSLRMVALKATAYFPLLKGGPGSGVLPVDGIDEIPDPNRDYKLMFEFSQGVDDTAQNKRNLGLVEIARVLNLHIASGIPLTHVHAVVVTHGAALYSIMNQDAFRAKYKKDNPNDSLITEMMNDGVKFVACGQAMRFADVEKSQLHAGVKVALTAQVMKSNFLGQGYVSYDISDDK